jgi:hypothetical protein
VHRNFGGESHSLCRAIYIHRVENIASASEKIKTRPRNNILGKTCLIIDDMSMLQDTLFAMSENQRMKATNIYHLPAGTSSLWEISINFLWWTGPTQLSFHCIQKSIRMPYMEGIFVNSPQWRGFESTYESEIPCGRKFSRVYGSDNVLKKTYLLYEALF